MPTVTVTTKKLVEVADLENVLAYKGNYMVFALKENNYITLHMMQDYLDVETRCSLRDPDELGNYSVDELQDFAACIIRNEAGAVRGQSRRVQAAADRPAHLGAEATATS